MRRRKRTNDGTLTHFALYEQLGPPDLAPKSILKPRFWLHLSLLPMRLWATAKWLTLALLLWKTNWPSNILSVINHPIDKAGLRVSAQAWENVPISALIMSVLAALHYLILDIRQRPEKPILSVGHVIYAISERLAWTPKIHWRYGTQRRLWLPAILNIALGLVVLCLLIVYWDLSCWFWFRAQWADTQPRAVTLLTQVGWLSITALLILALREDHCFRMRLYKIGEELLLDARKETLDRCTQYYSQLLKARTLDAHSDEYEFISQQIEITDKSWPQGENSYWMNLRQFPLKENVSSDRPRRQHSMRFADRTGLLAQPMHDRHAVFTIMAGPNQSIYIPESSSVMYVDTTRSSLNIIFDQQLFKSDLGILLANFLPYIKKNRYIPIDGEKLAETALHIGTALRHKLARRIRRERSAAQWLYDQPEQEADQLLMPPSADMVDPDLLDHPHIIVDLNCNLKIRQVFYADAVETTSDIFSYKIKFADVDTELSLNLIRTADKKLAEEFQKRSSRIIHSHKSTTWQDEQEIDATSISLEPSAAEQAENADKG